jgi:hypothetical protein
LPTQAENFLTSAKEAPALGSSLTGITSGLLGHLGQERSQSPGTSSILINQSVFGPGPTDALPGGSQSALDGLALGEVCFIQLGEAGLKVGVHLGVGLNIAPDRQRLHFLGIDQLRFLELDPLGFRDLGSATHDGYFLVKS